MIAAALAGIAARRNTFIVFAAMGVLYGVAGLILVSRLFSAPPNAEEGLELNVIAAAVIGGTSLLGGVGTVTGALLGALLMESLSNGMSLMNLPTYTSRSPSGWCCSWRCTSTFARAAQTVAALDPTLFKKECIDERSGIGQLAAGRAAASQTRPHVRPGSGTVSRHAA